MRQSTLQTIEPPHEPDNKSVRLVLSQLSKKEHGALLCYPGTDLRTFSFRVKQLRQLRVKQLILEGDSKIGKYGVLGKGCVSVVIRAVLRDKPEVVALKVRRADANRPSMQRDFELQKLANSFGVSPRAIVASQDFFAMEYVDSIKIGKWFEHLKTRTSKKYIRKLIRNILTQCYLLDIHKLDHGELSNPSKHILIRKNTLEPDTVIIDFESASTVRKSANLTSVVQFLLLGGWQGAKIRKILGIDPVLTKQKKPSFQNSGNLIKLLRTYKENPNKGSFEKVMSFINC